MMQFANAAALGSFWKQWMPTSSAIDTLLEKQDVTLEELLDEEDLIQETKGLNDKLLVYLAKPDVLKLLLHYLMEPVVDTEKKEQKKNKEEKDEEEKESTKKETKESEGEGQEEFSSLSKEKDDEAEEEKQKDKEFKKYKYPHLACEILISEVYPIVDALYEEPELVRKLYGYFTLDPPHPPLLMNYTARVACVLLQMKVENTVTILKEMDGFIPRLLNHAASPAAMELLTKLIECEATTEGAHSILPWLREQGLITSLIDKLQPQYSDIIHENAANTLQDIVILDNLYPSTLVAQLESREILDKLFKLILAPDATESTLLNGLNVIIALLKKPIDMASFDPAQDLETMAPLIQCLLDNLEPLHKLMKMDEKTLLDIRNNTNPTKLLERPLGFKRLRLVELFANLICTGYQAVERTMMKANIVASCLELFFAYSWNNFLHSLIESMISIILEGENDDLKLHLVTDADLLTRICDASDFNEAAVKNKEIRKGNMAHANIIAIKLLTLSAQFPALEKVLSEHERWQAFVKGPLAADREKTKPSPLDPAPTFYADHYEDEDSTLQQWEEGLEDQFEDMMEEHDEPGQGESRIQELLDIDEDTIERDEDEDEDELEPLSEEKENEDTTVAGLSNHIETKLEVNQDEEKSDDTSGGKQTSAETKESTKVEASEVKEQPETGEVKEQPETSEVKEQPETSEVKKQPETSEVKKQAEETGNEKTTVEPEQTLGSAEEPQ